MKKLINHSKVLLHILLFSALSSATSAQNDSKHLIGAQLGVQLFSQEGIKKDFIRKNSEKFDIGFNLFRPKTVLTTFGISDQINFGNEHFELVVGLNLAHVDTEFINYDEAHSNGQTLYIQVNKTEDQIDFLKVEAIQDNVSYIGVPISLKVNLISLSTFQLYIKPTVAFNQRIGNQRSVTFSDEDQHHKSDQILALFEKPKSFYSAFQFSTGMRLLNSSSVVFNLETDLAHYFISDQFSDIVDLSGGQGIKFIIQIPIK